MDLFGRDRSSGFGDSSNHILNEFLACLDGTADNNGVVVLASTNDVASMDEALVNRPGRFDMKIEMPLPDETDRLNMIGSFCNCYKAKCAGPNIKKVVMDVVNMTEGLTGAYIKDLIKTAVLRAVSKNQRNDDSHVLLMPDDLVYATNQIMKNYEIGKRAKKHI
jgi:SpoVK/Ycf46/Vps4 family AAA+-type ATPase